MGHSSEPTFAFVGHASSPGQLHASNWRLPPLAVGELVEFYSALTGHLRAFDVEDRWMQSLQPLPYEERTSELLSLRENLQKMDLPFSVAQGLTDALETTLQLASDLRHLTTTVEENEAMSAKLHAHQTTLEEALDEWLKLENTLPDQPETSAASPFAAGAAM